MRQMPRLYLLIFLLVDLSCAKDHPFLSGFIRRAYDATLTTCDPYNAGVVHSCLVFSSAFQESLYIYDATASEMVLSPMGYFPLKVKVGKATDLLVSVVSENIQFPFLLALDRAEPSLYTVRLFPSSNKSASSFTPPKKYDLSSTPYMVAAAEINDAVVALMTYPEKGEVSVTMLDKESGAIDAAHTKVIRMGTKPSHVVIDSKRLKAVISDEGETNIRVLDLANIIDVLTKGAAEAVDGIPVGIESEQVFLSHRDLGDGEHLYALVLKSSGKELKLINIDTKYLTSLSLVEDPMSAYFPDAGSDTCCQGNKQWVSTVSIKGNLNYYSIAERAGVISLEKLSTPVDLTSESNLALSKVMIKKIVGGAIMVDPNIKREKLCKNNRQTFYIAGYGNRRSHLDSESNEVEAHGYSCEGEETASRFGFKVR